MNNAEWVIENKPWIFDSFTCSECVKSYDGKHCPLSADEFDKVVCAKGHTAWLMRPHESSLEPPQTGDCEKDECEPAKEENAPESDADSREKLEADARELQERIWDAGARHDGIGLCHIIDLLDRQAAITKRECKRPSWEYCKTCETVTECDRLKERIAELSIEITGLKEVERLQAQHIRELEEHHRWIAEETYSAREIDLLEERDYWKGQFRACLGAAAKDGYALGLLKYPRPDNLIEPFQVVTSCIDDLRDCLADEMRARAEASWERDHWRETAGRLSDEIPLDEKLIEQRMVLEREMDRLTERETVTECDRLEEKDAPETPDFVENPQKTPENAAEFPGKHICDTCRFYTHVSDGTGDCHRWPREFVKDPDDWCGEWSE